LSYVLRLKPRASGIEHRETRANLRNRFLTKLKILKIFFTPFLAITYINFRPEKTPKTRHIRAHSSIYGGRYSSLGARDPLKAEEGRQNTEYRTQKTEGSKNPKF